MARSRPLAIDLFTGLHGWSAGLVDVGYEVIGYDLEDMCAQFGQSRPEHVRLVIQDVLTLHGSQFKDAALIVASPPCQEYSYMAMPWKIAKAKAAAIRADATGAELERLNRLFNACFRIQKEASIAAGRHIPMVVENVRGAQPWVGRARWSFGSFFLWGDVPALMPFALRPSKVPGFRFDGSGRSFQTASVEETGRKSQGMNWSDRSKRGQDFTRVAGQHCIGQKGAAGQRMFPHEIADIGVKQGGDRSAEARKGGAGGTSASFGSKSPARKAASAMIAKIPFPLAAHIGRTYWPHDAPLLRGDAA